MDSPQLLHLALLLLALAAPRPNIAMSTAGPNENTEDYSTEVTVYFCKDCKNCTCKSEANNFGKFEKILDIQNKMCSHGRTELVTNKTRTPVCFEKAKSCFEEICTISEQKVEGSKELCSILSSGEDGRGDLSTEKTVCCEADTGTRTPKCALKCLRTQKPCPDGNTTPTIVPGNREFPASKSVHIGMSIGIPLAVTVLLVCMAVAIYCVWRRHQAPSQDTQAPEGENIPLPEREPSSSLSECTTTS